MTKTKQMRKLFIAMFLCALLIVSIFALGAIYAFAADIFGGKITYSVNNNVVVDTSSLQQQYRRGETLDVIDLKLQCDGEYLPTETLLIYPDGSAISSKQFVLNQLGNYTLLFRANKDGSLLTQSYEFSVILNNYELSSSDDSIVLNYDYYGIKGTKVSLSRGETLHYSTVIDVSQMTKNDVLWEMYGMPATLGVGDFSYFEVKMVDRYDPAKYVVISFNYYHEYRGAYFSAGAENQPKSGYMTSDGNPRLFVDSTFGQFVGNCFFGVNHQGVTSIQPIQLRFDYATKIIYSGTGALEVIDLDNPKYFTNLWDGFTTGEVEIYCKADSYLSDRPAQFLITKIANTDLNVEIVKDETAPTITVDTADYDVDNLPCALVGQPYPVFPATYTDDYFNVKTQVSAYLNYYSNNKTNLDIKNNSFVPTREGTVYLEYFAVDGSGNESRKVLPITVKSSWTDISLDANKEFYEQTFYAGHLITLPQVVANGGFGNVSVVTNVTFNNQTTTLGDDLSFTPKQSGVYKVTHIATDYIGKTTESQHQLNVVISDDPVFTESPVYPRYLIADSEYTFLPMIAKTYYNNVEEIVDAKLEVKDGNGQRFADGLRYKASSDDNTVEFRYVAQSAKGTTATEWYQIKVIAVKNADKQFDLTKYFAGNVVATAGETSMSLVSSGSFEFINALLADGFQMEGSLNENDLKASCLRFTLTDAVNVSQSIEIDLAFVSHELCIRINNGEWLSMESADKSSFKITFDNQICVLGFGEFGKLNVSKTASGADFNGFDSCKVNLTFTFVNATQNSKVVIKSLNRQTLSGLKYDLLKPSIAVSDDIKQTAQMGSTYTIVKANAADVLDPNITFKMSVTDPQGEYVKDVNGKILCDVDPTQDYDIYINQYGFYFVQYFAQDASGRKESNIGYGIGVFDFDAPVITLSGKQVLQGKVNEGVYVPPATAQDNVDGTLTVTRFVISENGHPVELTKDGFKTNAAGRYVVNYYATDSSGNMTVYSYVVTITK